jgi:hypothetical protein
LLKPLQRVDLRPKWLREQLHVQNEQQSRLERPKGHRKTLGSKQRKVPIGRLTDPLLTRARADMADFGQS